MKPNETKYKKKKKRSSQQTKKRGKEKAATATTTAAAAAASSSSSSREEDCNFNIHSPLINKNIYRPNDTLISNMVMNVYISGVVIDMKKLILEYNGSFAPSALSPVRHDMPINGEYYSCLINSPGTIVVDNFNLNGNVPLFFNSITSWIIDWYFKKIMTFTSKYIQQCNLLGEPPFINIKFTIVNFAYSAIANFSLQFYKSIYLYSYLSSKSPKNPFLKLFIDSTIIDKIIEKMNTTLDNLCNVHKIFALESKFPAQCIQISFERKYEHAHRLLLTKSEASIRRQQRQSEFLEDKPLFSRQNTSVSIFPTGNILLTGAQTKYDMINVFNLWRIILNEILDLMNNKSIN